MVLATDMSKHFDQMKLMKNILSSPNALVFIIHNNEFKFYFIKMESVRKRHETKAT